MLKLSWRFVVACGIALMLSTILLAADPQAPIKTETYKSAVKVSCVGDSITVGVCSAPASWPVQLGVMLGEKWEVKPFGVSGATLLNSGDKPYQKEDACKNALESAPDVVIICLGSNDTKPGNWSHKEQFVKDYKELVEKFQKLESKPRIFISYAPFVEGTGNYGINEAAIKEQKPMIDKVAKDLHVGIINMHDTLAIASGKNQKVFADKVHPTKEGAELIAKSVLKVLTGKEYSGPSTLNAGSDGGKEKKSK